MAQVGGRGRRVQIVGVALVLLVIASCMGNGPDDIREPVRSAGRSAFERPAVFSADDQNTVRAVPAFRVSHALGSDGVVDPRPEKVSVTPKEETDEPKPGKPDDSDTPDPPEAKDTGGKVIFLTFDDGPTVKYTQQVLDLLDEYDAKATFFELGENATAHPELTRAVVARGHALGNHTWNHKDLRRLKTRNVNRQITRTSAALTKITGRPVTCLRPPYGAVNARVKKAIRRHDLGMKLWDIDPRDWKRPGADAIARRVLRHAHSGAVNLMHDGGGNRSQSVRALKRILRELSKKGYRFESLPGC
jgi:peptidoglycan/xylan/chitin deacetylase (PgdA/CDA1 family)